MKEENSSVPFGAAKNRGEHLVSSGGIVWVRGNSSGNSGSEMVSGRTDGLSSAVR